MTQTSYRNTRAFGGAMLAALALGTLSGPAAATEPAPRPIDATSGDVTPYRFVWGSGRATPSDRGPGCPQRSVTRANFDFDSIQQGEQLTIQAGLVNGEGGAQTYTLAATDFPIRIDLVQVIVASMANQQTTTHYTIDVWEGTPTTGTRVYSVSSSDDGIDPPHIVLPASPGAGQAAVADVQFSVDPTAPIEEQIVVNNTGGTNSFTVVFLIDRHNNASGCSVDPLQNAFPATEPGTCCNAAGTGPGPNLLTFPAENWLHAVSCPGGAPAGWSRFSQLEASQCFFGLCAGFRPSGDWLLRAKWTSLTCGTPTGACCLATGACETRVAAECPSGSGLYQGDNTTCSPSPCAQLQGACCFGTSCQTRTQAECNGFGGTFIGPGVACGTNASCPLGACCLPIGTCVANISQPACSAQGGVFRGAGSACATANCPPPNGACCATSGFCAALTQADCTSIPGATWRGALTTCTPDPCSGSGACCTGTSCAATTAGACAGAFRGPGTACSADPGNPTTCCPANFDAQSGVNVIDIFSFLAAWFAQAPGANFNGDAGVDVIDIFSFLSAWFAGC